MAVTPFGAACDKLAELGPHRGPAAVASAVQLVLDRWDGYQGSCCEKPVEADP
jgi:hypothetical protein